MPDILSTPLAGWRPTMHLLIQGYTKESVSRGTRLREAPNLDRV